MTDAQQLIEKLEQFNPKALQLAEVVSIAARVEPELLRKARLVLIPEADAGDEADLWFSPLVQTSNPLGFVFYPEVFQILRERLARNSDLLDKAWEKVIKKVHTGISPALFVEEEITWRSLKNPNDPEIENLLRKALVAMINEKDRNGVAYWALRALPNLPFNVHDMETAKMLETGAHMRLGDPDTFSVDLQSSPIPDWMPLLLPLNMERVKIGVRFVPGGIEFGELSLMEGAAELDLPQTNPMRVDVSWKEKSGKKHTYILIEPGEFVSLALDAKEIELRTISGEKYGFYKKKDVGIDFNELKENLKNINLDGINKAFEELVNNWHDDPRTLPLIRDYAINAEKKEIRKMAFNSLMEGWFDELLPIKEYKYSNEFKQELAIGLVNKTNRYGNAHNFKKMEFYLSELHELYMTFREEDLRNELAKGLSNATIQHGNVHNFEKMEIHLGELRELYMTFRDKNIGEELAKGLSNATIQHGNVHNFEKMEIHLGELRELNLTVKDKNLREELAKGLFSAINNSVKVHNFGKMELFFHELHMMHMNFKDKNVRLLVADSLRIVFPHVSDTKLAWDDLHQFTLDKDNDVRRSAVNTLGSAFSFVLNKEQAWEDLQRLTSDNNSSVRERAANALGIAFSHVPDKKKARNDLHRLTFDNDNDVRRSAADALGTAYSYIPEEYKKQSWDDLHRLTLDNDNDVRRSAADALGTTYSHIPEEYKKQSLDDLRRLTQDKDKDVRIAANYSSGRVSIFMASQANSDEKLRKELETAIGFFENVSSEATNFNPAKFCLPFYRSFYTIVFRKKEAEAEVIQYLAQAKGAVEGSKNKEKLLEAIESLGNALMEAHKAQEVQNFDAMKSDLNAYRRYCNRAFELLDTTEEKSPSASSLIRKGLPIIDERIKGIIAEIKEKAKAACQQSRGTLTEELAHTANREIQKWHIYNQEQMTLAVENLIFSLSTKIPHIPENNRIYDKIEEIRNESNITKQYQSLALLLALIPTVKLHKEDLDTSDNSQIIIGKENKQVQVSNPPSNSSEKPKTSNKSTKTIPNEQKIVIPFYTEKRWHNWINHVKQIDIKINDQQKGAIFVNMEDDVVLACLKIVAKLDKNLISKEDALGQVSEIKEIVLKQIEPITEDIDMMIESMQISLMGVFASCECYIEQAFEKTKSLKPLIKKAIEAEKEENMGAVLMNIAEIGANILAGGKLKDKDLEDIPDGLVAEWLDGIDSIRAAMIGNISYRDDEPDEEVEI